MVATSNNIQTLPPEFSRKGRFDEIFFVDLPDAGDRKVVASGAGTISTEIIKAELRRAIPLSRREAARISELREWAAANTIKA